MNRPGGFTGRNGWSACAAHFALSAVLLTFGVGCSPGGFPANETGSTSASTPASPPPSKITLVEHPDPEELFKLVLAEQEKCMRKLRRLEFTWRQETVLGEPGNEIRIVDDPKVIRDGTSFWCQMHAYPRYFPDKVVPDHIEYFVLNDLYLLRWGPGPTGNAGGHMWERDSLGELPEAVRGTINIAYAFPERRHAYGTGTLPLAEVGGLDPEKYPSRFEAERISDSDGRVF